MLIDIWFKCIDTPPKNVILIRLKYAYRILLPVKIVFDYTTCIHITPCHVYSVLLPPIDFKTAHVIAQVKLHQCTNLCVSRATFTEVDHKVGSKITFTAPARAPCTRRQPRPPGGRGHGRTSISCKKWAKNADTNGPNPSSRLDSIVERFLFCHSLARGMWHVAPIDLHVSANVYLYQAHGVRKFRLSISISSSGYSTPCHV